MSPGFRLFLAVLALWGFPTAYAQDVQVSRTNKTIQVTASTTLRVESEIARLHFGVKNFGATQQSAIDQNVEAADKITKAIIDRGVPKDSIETETIRIDRTRDTEYGANMKNVPEFVAVQEWTVSVSVAGAEQVLQLVIRAGANIVQQVEWVVSDPEGLSSKASTVALQKTRATAEQMAKQMNAKLGELLYISNSEPERFSRFDRGAGGGGMAYKLAAPPPPPPLPLHLFPAKVEQSATVTAVFAIE
jgi:hypothetical protein